MFRALTCMFLMLMVVLPAAGIAAETERDPTQKAVPNTAAAGQTKAKTPYSYSHPILVPSFGPGEMAPTDAANKPNPEPPKRGEADTAQPPESSGLYNHPITVEVQDREPEASKPSVIRERVRAEIVAPTGEETTPPKAAKPQPQATAAAAASRNGAGAELRPGDTAPASADPAAAQAPDAEMTLEARLSDERERRMAAERAVVEMREELARMRLRWIGAMAAAARAGNGAAEAIAKAQAETKEAVERAESAEAQLRTAKATVVDVKSDFEREVAARQTTEAALHEMATQAGRQIEAASREAAENARARAAVETKLKLAEDARWAAEAARLETLMIADDERRRREVVEAELEEFRAVRQTGAIARQAPEIAVVKPASAPVASVPASGEKRETIAEAARRRLAAAIREARRRNSEGGGRASKPATASLVPVPPESGLQRTPAPAGSKGEATEASCDGPDRTPAEIATSTLPAGRMRIVVGAPCRAGEAFSVSYGRYAFARKLDKAGRHVFDLDLFLGDAAEVAVVFGDGTRRPVKIVSLNLNRVSKVAVTWKSAVNIDLHALEYTTRRGGAGHVWAGHPSSAEAAIRSAREDSRGRGFMSTASYGTTAGDKVEVYTLWHPVEQRDGAISLLVDYESRGDKAVGAVCGDGPNASVSVTMHRLVRGRPGRSDQIVFASIPCGVELLPQQRFNPYLVSDLRLRR